MESDRDPIICYYHDPIVFSFDLDIFDEKLLFKDVDIEIIADILVVEHDHEINKSNNDINVGRFLDIDLLISNNRILSVELDASHHLEISMLQLFQRNSVSFRDPCSKHDSRWNVNIRYEAIDTYKNDEHDSKLYIFQYTWKLVQFGKRNIIMEQGWNILMKRPFIIRLHSIYTYIKDQSSIERALYNGFRMTSQESELNTEISYYVIGVQIDSSAFDIIIQDIEWDENVSLINNETSWSFPILLSRFLMFFRIDNDHRIVKRTDIAKYLSTSLPSLRIKWQKDSRVITTYCDPINAKDSGVRKSLEMNPSIILTRSPNVFSLDQVDIVEYTIKSNMSVPIYISCTIPKTVLPQKQHDASPISLDQNAWALTGPRHYHMKILLPDTELVVSWQLCPLIPGFVLLPPLLITWTTIPYVDSSKSYNHSFQHLYSKLVHVWVDTIDKSRRFLE